MYGWMARRLGARGVPRRDEVGDRAVVLVLLGRFVDELASELPLVLMPTLQAGLGLSVTQVGWLLQALYSSAAVVEPLAAAAIDVARRRPLLVWGALGWATAVLMVAAAPSYVWLLAAFVLMGTASGPLAHTSDVLLVEMHPGAEERIGARQTMVDTVGALLAPAAVAATGWVGADQRVPLVVTGIGILCYALQLARTRLPGPRGAPTPMGDATGAAARAWRQVRGNAGEVLRSSDARIWLVALFGESLMDVWWLLTPVWLARDVGASQAAVAVHTAVALAASLVGLLLLDRWLERHDARTILRVACAAGLVAFPGWLLVPGVDLKIAAIVPLTLAVTPIWPIARARALAAVPGRGGMVLALTSLYGVVPIAAAVGWIGDRVGLAPTMLAVHTAGTLLILATIRRSSSVPTR
ncbi:MAG: MFS transporter [Actinobacteria bacterium]|nr:MFS transporter [Actinomycetota bacterium]